MWNNLPLFTVCFVEMGKAGRGQRILLFSLVSRSHSQTSSDTTSIRSLILTSTARCKWPNWPLYSLQAVGGHACRMLILERLLKLSGFPSLCHSKGLLLCMLKYEIANSNPGSLVCFVTMGKLVNLSGLSHQRKPIWYLLSKGGTHEMAYRECLV